MPVELARNALTALEEQDPIAAAAVNCEDDTAPMTERHGSAHVDRLRREHRGREAPPVRREEEAPIGRLDLDQPVRQNVQPGRPGVADRLARASK